MLRFGFMVLFVTTVGWIFLTLVAPDLAPTLILFVFGLLAAAVVLKLVIDFTLHFKKMRAEEDARNKVQPDERVEVYHDMEAFRKATERKGRRR